MYVSGCGDLHRATTQLVTELECGCESTFVPGAAVGLLCILIQVTFLCGVDGVDLCVHRTAMY